MTTLALLTAGPDAADGVAAAGRFGQKEVLVPYKQWQLPGHKVDLIIEGCVIVELKAVDRLTERDRQQVLSYLKATCLRLGYVLNFNVEVFKAGIVRVVL
jgi:GxxExxY protein